MDGQARGVFYASLQERYRRCLEPSLTCRHDAIRAHSVQNNGALSLIEEAGHVYGLQQKLEGSEVVVRFGRVGRNNASVFTGYCGDHDAEIFKPIDTRPLVLDDHEQLFLLAYRAVSRELHVAIEWGARVQNRYEALKQASSNMVPRARFEANQHMLKAWGTWRYRLAHFDKPFASGRFDRVKHSIIRLQDQEPVLAASSFCSVDFKLWGKPFAAVVTNVIPIDTQETVVIFSYSAEHSGKVRKAIAPIMLASGREQKYELSHFLINKVDNFFISPRAMETWTDEKKRHIEEAFMSNVGTNVAIPRTPELMLF